MAPKTVVSLFNAASRAEFLASPMFHCGGEKNYSKSLPAGTRILFSDFERKEIFGSAIVGIFPDGSGLSVRPASPLDEMTYSGTFGKFNSFQICLEKGSVKFFTISYDDLAFLVGINNAMSNSNDNNLTLPNRYNFTQVRYRGAEEDAVRRRIDIWLKGL